MKDQVIMSPHNGQLAIAVPLFRLQHSENLDFGKAVDPKYNLTLTAEKPLAYALDCDEAGIALVNAEWLESHVEFLGDL